MKEYEEFIDCRVGQLVVQLTSSQGKTIDLSMWLTYLS
jgi:hypothetical protein